MSAELVELGESRDGIGRVRVPAGRRQELVAAFRRSGLTRRKFARQEGVRYTTFCTWVQRAERTREMDSARPAKRPVVPGVGPKPMRFVEVAQPAGVRSGLEVRLADGTTVRGARVAELAALVRALRS